MVLDSRSLAFINNNKLIILDMIKFFNVKNICMSFILLGLGVFQACDDVVDPLEIKGSNENFVFISADVEWAPADALLNSSYYTLSSRQSGITLNNATTMEGSFVVKCLRPAANDIKVQFELDNSLVPAAYNLLPEGVRFTVDKYELTIPKGETVSDGKITYSINTDDVSKFPIPNYYDGTTYGYMSPVIKIASVSNASLSSSINTTTASIAIKGNFATNLMTGSTTVPSGTLGTTKTGWTATVGGVLVSNNYLFDNAQSTTNYVTIANALLPASLEIDMQSVQMGIRGMRIQHSARDNHGASVNVYIKETESEEYKLQGPALALSRPTNSTPWPHSIRFTNAVNARYIKLEFRTAYNNGTNDLRITEFGIYQ